MKYKAVIFDFDDTLVESRVVKWAHHKHVAKKFYNIDLSDDDIKKHWGKPIGELVKILYKSSDTLENMYEALISVREQFRKSTYPGAQEVINKLLAANIKVGIVSATNRRFLFNDLVDDNFSVDKMFLIQGADNTEFHKPDPRVFNDAIKLLEKEGIAKNETVYIGDSINDLDAAHGAGINFIGITTGLYAKEDFEKGGAKVIIKDINEVVAQIL
jgi:phosphoglycolate phosphatase